MAETPDFSAYLRAIGAKGGAATTKRKADSARANGARGGRPRKSPSGTKPTQEIDTKAKK